MQQRFAQQVKKGALEMLVLKLLVREEKYGYQLITELRERTDGAISLKEGTLYPILYRLEDSGLVESRLAARADKEPARKYYAITGEGRTALEEMRGIWNEFDGHVRSIMEEEQ
ncbi:PadR family transcriptional regulator [Arabiibacter massiliensis]|uniref:PadR family transcriptional regulator n=1 Tax=Arabiibacter massiliensis TaxID=1870985 RepID=UPI0009B9CCBC|nr:PadR family transcriptional regulator [Arabiibacter massiliensis]